ncbi:hypothetical protein NKF26_16455 [Haladaptatus sp. AB618]|uniref:hypothetical protein n=1 Tax=Haladaptatus sp. AB618 TaxID=2934173 RepID=UPI00209C507F|nr:hypothetical protein [Haladaptatus sp. AB618]MCO8255400.1 hypothetical protein [Haladaptatus sp. AB618]
MMTRWERTTTPRAALGGVGLLVVGIAFWVGGGVIGLLAAGLTLVLWYLTAARYAVTFGQVGLATLVPTSAPFVVAAGECGLLVLLIGSLATVGTGGLAGRRILVGVGVIAVTGGGTWLLYLGSGTLWVPTVGLVIALVLASYGLLRYETVVRKTLSETEAADAHASAAGVRGADT